MTGLSQLDYAFFEKTTEKTSENEIENRKQNSKSQIIKQRKGMLIQIISIKSYENKIEEL